MVGRYNARNVTGWYGGKLVKFKALLEQWKTETVPALTAEEYLVRLPLEDAARLRALQELFPGRSLVDLITDLLGAALQGVEAAMPYERGPKVISSDDHGDPVYEDVGLTPRFIELTRKYTRSLESDAGKKRA